MGFTAILKNMLHRLGWVPIPQHRSVVISVPDLEACAGMGSILAELGRQHDRLSFRFIAGTPRVRDWIAARFPGSVLPAPLNNRLSAVAFLLASRARMVLGVRQLGAAPVQLVKTAYSLGIAIAVVDAEAPEGRKAIATAPLVAWWAARDGAAAAGLKASGISQSRIVEVGRDTNSIAERLRGLMAQRPVNRRRLQRLVSAGLEHPTWRRLVNVRAERIATLDGLRTALAHPETILCLGNGPSSEDPSVLQARYDSLFRVNHRWIERGVLCNPDMVFTGQKRALFTVHGTIFAFQTRRAEGQLVTHQVFNPLCRRMRFVTLDRLGILGNRYDWDGLRPTNGATMLATAVALKPRRLIVAGIDLFSDPLGAYPGDATVPNAYVLVHDASFERQFIMETLARYEGELVIVGQALAEHWNAYRRMRQVEPVSG